MHEGNFTEQIVEAILKELAGRPDFCPKRIQVKVGEMLHLEPASVQMHFQVLTQGTPLEGTPMDLEEVPVLIRCGQCGREGAVEDHHLLMCPDCSSRNVQMLQGDAVVIDAIEMEDSAEGRN